MDYEQKYKEALGRASHIKNDSMVATPQEVAEYLFPELRESEDERIRKAIIYNLSNLNIIYNATKEECLAWLEKQKEQVTDESDKVAAAYQLGRSDERKQKEQKSAWSTEDERIRQLLVERVRTATDWSVELRDSVLAYLQRESPTYKKEALRMEYEKGRADAIAEMKEQKPAEWREEDKRNLDNIIWLCENCEKGIENVWIPSQAKEIKRLIKSLRPQPKASVGQGR